VIAVVTLVALAAPASAQAPYPSRPIRIVVPYTAGTGIDVLARVIGQKLGDRLKVAVVVENRPGASGNIGTEAVAKAAPDGYTLLMTASTHVTNAALQTSIPYDPVKSFTPIAPAAVGNLALVVHPAVPARSVQELVALAKAQPGKLNYASPGSGTPHHLAMELFKILAKVNVVHVPYKGGGPAMADLVGGQISGSFASMPSSIPFVRAGKLRALAVTAPKRSPAEPQVPTISEAGIPGFAVLDWQGLFTTGKTPPAIVNKLNAEVVRILALPDVVEKLAVAGVEIQTSTPREWGDFVKSEIAKWGKVVKEAGIKVE